MRKLLPFLVAILLAFLVAAVSEWLNAPPGVVYALAGFSLGVLLAGGIPFALRAPLSDLKDRNGVHAKEAAVVAEHAENGDSATDHEAFIITHDLQEQRLFEEGPVVVRAGRAVGVDVLGVESLTEAFGVRHSGAL